MRSVSGFDRRGLIKIMTEEKDRLIVDSGSGTCISGLIYFVLLGSLLILWAYSLGNYLIEQTGINRTDLPGGYFWMLGIVPGYLVHELTQAVWIRIFGGRPRWGMRPDDKKLDLMDRYRRRTFLLQSITLQTYSPGTRFSLIQYLVIVLSPIPVIFIVLPLLMVLWTDPRFYMLMFSTGLISIFFLPRDLILAGMVLFSGSLSDVDIVDKENGTYASPRR